MAMHGKPHLPNRCQTARMAIRAVFSSMRRKLAVYLRELQMYKLIITACLSACLTVGHAQITLPAASPASTVIQQVGLGTITIAYGRPSLKGRTMFGDRVPYG